MLSFAPTTRCTAFLDHSRLAWGELRHVAIKIKQRFPTRDHIPGLLVFNDQDGTVMDLDLRGSLADVTHRYGISGVGALATQGPATDDDAPKRGRGRPRLGVVPREITLLPRHWQWLSAQPGGASVALRKLVDAARRQHAEGDLRRAAQERAYRFLSSMGGDRAGFDEATRALFAGDSLKFEAEIAAWPDDVRDHATMLAADAWPH